MYIYCRGDKLTRSVKLTVYLHLVPSYGTEICLHSYIGLPRYSGLAGIIVCHTGCLQFSLFFHFAEISFRDLTIVRHEQVPLLRVCCPHSTSICFGLVRGSSAHMYADT